MKHRSLPVKRLPVRKSSNIFRRISAVTNRQRAATATAEDIEIEDSGSKVSRALTIIFLIHVVAIGLIFIHQRFIDGQTPAPGQTTAKPVVTAPATPKFGELPRLASGEKPYIVKTGDNYARIAEAQGVDEADLRAANGGVDIVPNLILRIPPKRIVAEVPEVITELRARTPAVDNRGLVEAIDVSNAPKAVLVRGGSTDKPVAAAKPQTSLKPAAEKPATASGKSHVIASGDNLWRIAKKYGTTPAALKKANGNLDERRLKPGVKLIIP